MSNASKCDRLRSGKPCNRPTGEWSYACPKCLSVERARAKRDHAKRVAECWERGAVARAAMPRLAAWCAKVNESKRVEYLIPRVARSGMSRWIELFHCGPDGLDVCWPDIEPEQMKDEPAKAYRARLKAYRDTFRRLSWSWKRRCFVVGGCGMDMVFATVTSLGHVFGYYDFGNSVQRYGISRAE